MSRALILVCLLLSVAPPVWGVGAESFGSGPLQFSNCDEWPSGLEAVFYDNARVYASWENGGEIFCFRGGSKELNNALERFSKVEMPVHEVFLVPGPRVIQSFYGKKITCGWTVEDLGGIARHVELSVEGAAEVLPVWPRLTIYISEAKQLKQLKVPENIDLSGPEQLNVRYVHALEKGVSCAAQFLAGLEPYSPESAKKIAALLDNPDAYARARAACALGRMGAAARDTIPALQKALAGGDHYEEGYQTAIDKIQAAAPIDKTKAKAREALAQKINAFLRRKKS